MKAKIPKQTLSFKAEQLHRTIKFSDLKEHLQAVTEKHPEILNHVYNLATQCKNTPMEGLPFTIATLRAQLYSYEEIADALHLKLKDIQKISKTQGFDQVVHLLQPMIWSDLVLAAQACIMFHLRETKDVSLAKWLLESVGEVKTTTQPLTLHQHHHQTLNLQGQNVPGLPGSVNNTGHSVGRQPALLPGGSDTMNAEDLAQALFNRFKDSEETKKPAFRLSS